MSQRDTICKKEQNRIFWDAFLYNIKKSKKHCDVNPLTRDIEFMILASADFESPKLLILKAQILKP